MEQFIHILTANASSTTYEVSKFRQYRASDAPLHDVYIPKFGKISEKNSIRGSHTLIVAPLPNFTLIGATYHPCVHDEKLQTRPLLPV